MKKQRLPIFLEDKWKEFRKGKPSDFFQSPDTSVNEKTLIELANSMHALPEGKKYFRKIVKLFNDRLSMLKEDRLDWAMGELLAYATLLD